MKPRALTFVLLAACGGGAKNSSAPSADVVIADVDGGTVIGAATPNTKKAGPSRTEARALSYRECRALAMHVVEILGVDPDTMREATYDPSTVVNCDKPVFSDEVFDCMIVAQAPMELLSCAKFGNPLER